MRPCRKERKTAKHGRITSCGSRRRGPNKMGKIRTPVKDLYADQIGVKPINYDWSQDYER